MNELDASSLLAIVSHLRKPSDLLRIAQASTALASVCKSQSLWQQLVEEKFDLLVCAPPAAFTTQVTTALDTTAAASHATAATDPAPHADPAAASHAQAAGGQSAQGLSTCRSGPCRSLDLQQTYKALATAPPAGALRFAAVFTDGGCDGMREGDLTYWADHAFQPNHWSPHCSDGRSNINIIGLLQPHGLKDDDRLARHRSYLVERCAAAAAVLFSPPSTPHQTREQAAASLNSWSTTGLERLFLDLYQDLWLHQQDSTWGRLLLSGVPQPEWPQEFIRLGLTADSISGNLRHQAYSAVEKVPQHEIEAAAAAASAAGSSGSSRCRRAQPPAAAAVAAALVLPAAAAAVAALPSAAAAAAAAAVPDDSLGRKVQVSATAGAGGGAGQGSNAASRRQQYQQYQQGSLLQQQQHQEQRVLLRHMADKRLLPWLSTPVMNQCTALVYEVVVSRIGHFTCPVAAGALLLEQHPSLNSSCGSSSGGSSGDGSSSSSSAESQQYQAVLQVKQDPLVAALDNCTSFEAVTQAVSAGVLPALVHHTQFGGVEWCEFSPLSRQQRQERQQQGWYMRPVVWFRFSTPQPEPTAAQDADAAAAPGPADAGVGGVDAAAAADWEDDDQHMAAYSAAAAAVAAGNADADASAGVAAGVDVGASDASDAADSLLDSGSSTDPGFMSDEFEVEGLTAEELTFAMELPPAGWQHPPPPPAAAGAGAAAGGAAAGETAAAAAEPIQVQQDTPQSDGNMVAAGSPSPLAAGEGEASGPCEPQPHQPLPPPQQHQQQQQHGQLFELHHRSSGNSSSSSSSRRPPKAPWQQHGAPGVTVLPAPTSLQELDHSSSEPHVLLRMPLSAGPRSGNMALLKLISCENKMAEYDDPSEEPNIDVQYVALRGVAVTLDQEQPEGCRLQLL